MESGSYKRGFVDSNTWTFAKGEDKRGGIRMIYITGDTHSDFTRFTKKRRGRLPFKLTEKDIVIVCGDLGLLWCKDKTFDYNLDWMSRLPFKILWVAGNHENYDMIEEYNIEEWHGGKVRHILRNKIIYLERGQVFKIEGKKFFTFGGASSHDIQGGILDIDDPAYTEKRITAIKSGLPYRVKGISWWEQELPSETEMKEGIANLEKIDYRVDYVITHCCSSKIQDKLERYHGGGNSTKLYGKDVLTEYFDALENRMEYKRWYCGHYHVNMDVDEKHTVLYQMILPLIE